MSAPMVRKAWKRIEAWCRTYAPEHLRRLNPGASRTEIRKLETAIKHPLPEDLKASLSIHNGSSPRDEFLFESMYLLSCDQIARDHAGYSGSFLNELPAEERRFRFYPPYAIAHHYFNKGWISIASFDSESLAIDIAPGQAGTSGQVIDFGKHIHMPGVMASSWGEYLLSYADLLDIVIDLHPNPRNRSEPLFEPLLEICEGNWFDGIVLWARDGWWPIVHFAKAWRTSTVLALAQNISKSRDFDSMPILADALQDAGCDAAAVLNHCRDRNCHHSDGCWIINTLLSRKVTKQRNCHQFRI